MYLICVTVACRAVNDLYYLIAGGLSKKPGQVGDSRVNHTIRHVTTKAWQTHIETDSEGASERKNQEKMCPRLCVCFWLFLMQSFTQQMCISLLHIICISLCFSQKLLASLSYYCKRCCLVRGGEVWAGTDMILITLMVCDAVATDSDCLFTFTQKSMCTFVLISLTGSIWGWKVLKTEVGI